MNWLVIAPETVANAKTANSLAAIGGERVEEWTLNMWANVSATTLMNMSELSMEMLLSVTLLAGVFVNLGGAWTFFRHPDKSAQELGFDLKTADGRTLETILILMRLVGICVVALAFFYFLTALGPLAQVWNVIAAILARLAGTIYYAWTLAKTGRPAAFKKYLSINLALAVSHAGALAWCPGAAEALYKSMSSFYWLTSLLN